YPAPRLRQHIAHGLRFGPGFRHFAGVDRVLHPCPTRRSSDLFDFSQANLERRSSSSRNAAIAFGVLGAMLALTLGLVAGLARGRSEEHTSELQSRENLVCRLLLGKKKKQPKSVDCDRSRRRPT